MNHDQLLSHVGRMLDRLDGENENSRELAYAALGWRDLDAELAELVFDSAIDEAPALVRSSDDLVRLLTFRTTDVAIDIELSGDQLIGQVVPPTATAIELLRPSGDVLASTESDDLGVFTIDRMPDGPASLVIRALDGSWSVRTAWTTT